MMTRSAHPLDPDTEAIVLQAMEVAARIYWRRFGGTIEIARATLPDVLAELVVDVVEGPTYGEGYFATPDEHAAIVRALEAME